MTDQTAMLRRRHSPLSRLATPLVSAAGRRLLDWTPTGSISLTLPGGHRRTFGTPSRQSGHAELALNNFRLIPKALRRGALGFAEAYIDGDIDTPDLLAVFGFFVANQGRLDRSGGGLFRVRGADRRAHAARRNSLAGSRRNIAEHYDLGNAFYGCWLDRGLNYSSGLYGTGARTLEEAQAAKIGLIADLLRLTPGCRVLEIGCGWGALALELAERGARVTGVTLSREQLAYARKRLADAGMDERVALADRDYRDVTGTYDRIASVEMVEAVGEENWPVYFGTLSDRLAAGGVAVLQAITIDEARFERYRRSPDFVQRYIFPGGALPTRSVLAREAARAGLVLERKVRFGESYARTLAEWRDRFEDAWPEIKRLGFDERFRRKWRYYLAYCEAGFRLGLIDVGAYRLVKG